MHDSVATFYGGYDQVARRRIARLRISRVWIALVVAVVVLVVFVAADVAAYQAGAAVVHVTEVNWFAGGELLTTTAGFTLHPSEATTFPVVCQLFCVTWTGASVGAPFSLAGFTSATGAVQYTNVTVRAPASAYSGPLNITLLV